MPPLTNLLSTFRSLSLTSKPTTASSLLSQTTSLLRQNAPFKHTTTRAISTSPTLLKVAKGGTGAPGGKGGKKGKRPSKTIAEQRIALIRYHMQHPLTPRPLRLSRLRSLRHWTIHRAWLLARRNKLAAEEGELQRMHQSMHDACEELRLLDTNNGKPETKDSGRLYRIAMEKRGVFGHGGVPIEYGRFQVDTPGKEAWNHGWTR